MPRPNKINAAAFFVGTQAAHNDKESAQQNFADLTQKNTLLISEMPGQYHVSNKHHGPKFLDKAGTLFNEAIKNSLDSNCALNC